MGTSGECINRRKKRETEPSTEHKENIRLLYEIQLLSPAFDLQRT